MTFESHNPVEAAKQILHGNDSRLEKYNLLLLHMDQADNDEDREQISQMVKQVLDE